MSRSGYCSDCECDDPLELGRQRAAVSNSIAGKRGQAFLRDLAATLDVMPEKRLAAHVWDEPITGMPFAPQGGEVCALGAVTRARGIDTSMHDPDDDSAVEIVASQINISIALAREIVWMNDDAYSHRTSPEERWRLVREWLGDHIKQNK